jgi:hypothetical protein
MANIGPVCAVQSLTSAHVSILLVTAVDVLLPVLPSPSEVCIYGSASI